MRIRSRRIAMAGWLTVSAAVLLTIGWTDQSRDGSGDKTAIVAAEIVVTDYRATHSDGPMYAVARVTRVVKGKLSKGSELRFAESAHCGPTYKAGEHRILFLAPVTAEDPWSSARWMTQCPASGRIDYFVAKESIANLSSVSLESFLKDVREADSTPPGVEPSLVRTDESAFMISLKLTNMSHRPVWLNPSKVSVSFNANGTSHYPRFEFGPARTDAWAMIAPTESITGALRIPRGDVKGTGQIVFAVSHRSVSFPNNSWAGTTLSTPLKLDQVPH